MRVCTPLACLILAACSGSSTSATPDAGPMADAAAMSSVHAVTCPTAGTPPTVTTSDSNDTSFMPPTTTISAHGIVRFAMSSIHNVMPNPPNPTDPGLMVDFGKMVCLEFDRAGTFSFRCSAHFFVGTIVVQ